MKGPCWIKQWIADLAMLNEQFRNEDGTVDFAALGREEYLFRTALITGNFSKSSRAKDVYDIAKKAYDSLSEKGKKGGRPRKDDNGAVAEVAPKVVDEDSHRTAAASLAYSGRSGLVRLTDDEYNMLLQEVGNKKKADKLIDSLDYELADGKKFKASHFQVLTHWNDYREEKAAAEMELKKAEQEAKAEAFSNVDRRTPYQKNQDDLLRLYQETSAALKAM